MDLYVIPITDFPVEDKFIIYRPLAGLAFVGNRAMAEFAQTLAADSTMDGGTTTDSEAYEFLRLIGYLNPDPPLPEPALRNCRFLPTSAVLLLTNQCQLRCIYCYASAGESSARVLSVDLGFEAIDHVYQNALQKDAPKFKISFHGGGEPTYAWKVIKALTSYARQKSLPAEISLTSNGIWSPRMCDWIIENMDSISLSFDGRPETQNSQRPLVSGKDSSSIIMRNIVQLDKKNAPYGIRLTAIAPWERLPEEVCFVCEETSCQAIQVEPAFNEERGRHDDPRDREYLIFVDAFLAAHEIALHAGRHLRYSGARLGLSTTTFCKAPYNALIVNTAGDLVTCYQIDDADHPLAGISTIGYIKGGDAFIDHEIREELHSLMAERRDNCQGCFCYWSCAGDCYVRTFQDQPDGHLIYSNRCQINRHITERILLREIEAGNGVWSKLPIG